jgi:hypothetical protein
MGSLIIPSRSDFYLALIDADLIAGQGICGGSMNYLAVTLFKYTVMPGAGHFTLLKATFFQRGTGVGANRSYPVNFLTVTIKEHGLSGYF